MAEPAPDPYYQRLGDRLRTERRRLGLKQHEVGTSVGVSETMMSGFERGTRRPPAPVLRRLATLYGVQLEALIPEDGAA